MSPEPNAKVIRSTWRWLAHGDHGVSEVRVIRPVGGIVGIGFFDDEEAFVRECLRTNAIGNVYVGIQPRPVTLLSRAPNAIRPLKRGATRQDIEVVTATVIDLDPVRPKDTASTNEELAQAIAAATSAADWCAAEGLVRPRLMMSGNGAQLWFSLPPTHLAEHEHLAEGLKRFETELRERFQTEQVHVDSIHDVARIIKVIGTVSHKGDGQGERPHRVSAAQGSFERSEDPRLLERLTAPPEPEEAPARRVSLPVVGAPSCSDAGTVPGRAAAPRARDDFDWEHPVDMCGPVQRLWDQGADDRSLAIFNMVRFFAHKGLPLGEIIELITEYDRRGLGKLQGRDAAAYITKAHDKVMATAREDGTVAPPCHALQKLDYCKVHREPGARCDLYDVVFDVEKAIEAVPVNMPVQELEYRLKPILLAIAQRDPSMHGRYLELVEKRFGLKAKDLRKALARAAAAPANEEKADDAAAEPDAIEGEIYEDAAFYYCLTARGETKILSSFTIEPTMRVETEDGELIMGEARTDRGTTVRGLRLPLTAFHSKRDLIRLLPSADMQWTGSDNNVQGLLRVLARRPVPRKPGSTMLGDYRSGEHHVWLGPDCAIGPRGFLTPSPVIYVPSGGSLDKRVNYRDVDEDTFLLVASTVFECLPQVNKPEVILPILGWFFATPLKPRFMEAVGSFPTLFVWGTQGSGKSSLCIDIMWPLFGVRDAEPYSATETEFALLKLLTSTRSVPIFIDEYKPYDMQRFRVNTLHRYLRRLYRGETEERGRPDQRVNTYHLQAPVCIAGETRPTEAALLERIITSNPAKTTLSELPSCKRAHQELRAQDLTLFAPRYIQFCLGRDFAADLQVARAATTALIGERKVPIRIAENLTAMLLGIHLFEEFARHCGFELPEDLGAQAAVDAILADLLETDHGVKNALDHFVEMLGVMAVQNELKHRIHYVFNDGRLAIHLESAYDAFRAHCKRIDYEGELVDLKALRRLVLENKKQDGYVASDSERVYFAAGDRRRAMVVDLTKTTVVTEDDFPQRGESEEGSFRESFKSRYGWNDS